MTLENFFRIVRKVGNQAFCRHWLAYGSNGLADPGLGLAIGILLREDIDGALRSGAEEKRWSEAFKADGHPPRAMRLDSLGGTSCVLLAFWDRTEWETGCPPENIVVVRESDGHHYYWSGLAQPPYWPPEIRWRRLRPC